METNVALQLAPEKWAAGEALYEQPEKVTYIYGCQKKARENRSVARLLVKPSRSYDNELEANVSRDVGGLGSKVRVNTIRDDINVSCRKRSEQLPREGEGRRAHQRHPFAGHATHERLTHRAGYTDSSSAGGVESYGSRSRCHWKPTEPTHKPRHRNAPDSHHTHSSHAEDIHGHKVSNPHLSKQRTIPVEFHLTEDQLSMSGPRVQLTRPANLSTPFSPASSLSRDKPSSLVILEIKDGPTFFYKPSNHMLSDEAMADEMAMSSRGCLFSAQAAAGYSSPDTGGLYSRDPSKTSSASAYKGSLSFSNPDTAPYSPFRRNSATSSYSGSPVSIGAAGPSLEEISRFRGHVSHLPRTPGLRKPDLSVLSSPHKSRAHSFDDVTTSTDLHKSDKQLSLLVKVSPVQSETTKSGVFIGTMTHGAEMKPSSNQEPSLSQTQLPYHTNLGDTKQNSSAVLGIDPPPQQTLQDRPLQAPVAETALDASRGFQNLSEILQQKAGIKHDDIVVGCRRPASGLNRDSSGETLNTASVVKPDSVAPASAVSKSREHGGLSLSTEGLAGITRVGLLKDGSSRRKHTHSESEVTESVAAGDSSHKPGYVKTQFNKTDKDMGQLSAGKSLSLLPNEQPARTPTGQLSAGKSLSLLPNEQPARTPTGQVSAAAGGADIYRRQEGKADSQKSHHGKIPFGYHTELRNKVADLAAVSSSASSSYSTKSLDRNLKPLAEVKHTPKSISTSPARQQHPHSPKTKSALPTPVKKIAVSSKLHMLSNIPVPMCHDPPAKRLEPYRQPPTPEPGHVLVAHSAGDKDLSCADVKSTTGDRVPNLGELETSRVSTAPQSASILSAQPCSGVALNAGCQDSRLGMAFKTPGSVPSSDTVLDGSRKQNVSVAVARKDSSTPAATVASGPTTAQPSTATSGDVQPITQSATSSPVQVPVKPRLHRSAEHLLGDTKLTVFNSTENVLPHFDNTESSSNRPFPDSPKPDMAERDSISPLKKNHGLAKIGIMRRGSDRTEVYRRGSDRAILSIDENDRSMEDLKKATSLKELCQSMASLLNIDNVKAAEMITTSLSQRQDLVEGLDADAIMDYLSHHGVLDPHILVGLDDKSSITQRNSAILRHVEEHGNTAVALFINALRQSGQLHLASSLDTEQRIQPVSGKGYFGKDRHKGELTIKIEIESLKIIAPREPRSEKIVDTSLLGTPGRQTPDSSGVVIKDAADEEDFVKPRSCWCFCFSYKNKMKSSSKKDTQKQGRMNWPSSLDKVSKPAEEPSKDSKTKPHRTKSQDKAKKMKESSTKLAITDNSKKDLSKNKDKETSKKSKSSRSKSKTAGKYSVPNNSDSPSTADTAFGAKISSNFRMDDKSNSGLGDACRDQPTAKMMLGLNPCTREQSQTTQLEPYSRLVDSSGTFQGQRPDKESWDPIIMEYDPKLELIKLRAGQEELASPTRQSGNIGIMCEQWKSNGRHFQQKASLLCERIVRELQTEIIKYFEQDRGTLVLDVVSGISSILVINICMKRAQVRQLQQEIADKSLLTKMEDMFFSRVNIKDFDIRGVNLRIILDEQELNTVLSELS